MNFYVEVCFSIDVIIVKDKFYVSVFLQDLIFLVLTVFF